MVDKQILLYTSALIDTQFDKRKIDYEMSYDILSNLINHNSIFIVECYSNEKKFLSNFKSPTFLTKTHLPGIKNKGVLEIMCIKKFLENTEISDDTLIIKMTGRYKFINDDFFSLIKSNGNFDFYGKLIDKNTQIFTGCFALRKKYFVKLLNFCDLQLMEKNMVNFEKIIFDFLEIEKINSFFVERINIECPIFGYGNVEIHNL